MNHKIKVRNKLFMQVTDKPANSLNTFTNVKASIDSWVALSKEKSILRIRGEFTIEYTTFIHWN